MLRNMTEKGISNIMQIINNESSKIPISSEHQILNKYINVFTRHYDLLRNYDYHSDAIDFQIRNRRNHIHLEASLNQDTTTCFNF